MKTITFTLLALFTLGTSASAQEAKGVKLRWFGNSFFQIESTLGKTVVFDPHAIPVFQPQPLTADVILISHEHSDHTQVELIRERKASREFRGLKLVNKKLDWNLVNEKVGAISVRSVGVYHDNNDGFQRGKVAAFIVEVDGLKFCHLGDIGHVPTDAQAKLIGPIDILMVPVGGIYTLNGEGAKATVEKLKPRLYALPMHYGVPGFDELLSPEEFLDGKLPVKKTPETNELTINPEMQAEKPTIIMLGWTTPKK
jgi:L-ascorbate metabolism protein UlaG (beta-lactamase superfamily)